MNTIYHDGRTYRRDDLINLLQRVKDAEAKLRETSFYSFWKKECDLHSQTRAELSTLRAEHAQELAEAKERGEYIEQWIRVNRVTTIHIPHPELANDDYYPWGASRHDHNRCGRTEEEACANLASIIGVAFDTKLELPPPPYSLTKERLVKIARLSDALAASEQQAERLREADGKQREELVRLREEHAYVLSCAVKDNPDATDGINGWALRIQADRDRLRKTLVRALQCIEAGNNAGAPSVINEITAALSPTEPRK